MNLRDVAPPVLMSQLGALLSTERRTIVAFLEHLAEVERRQIHLALGHSSLFAFCTERLRLAKSSAHRRVAASRLLTRFPAAGPYLEDGRLSLTTFSMLRHVLDDVSVTLLLEQAAGKTEEEIAVLVATLHPNHVPRDLLRRLPRREANVSFDNIVSPASSGPIAMVQANKAPATIVPITAELRRLNVTVGPRFVEALQRAKSLLSHKIPSGNLETVLLTCVELACEELEKRRLGSKNPRPPKPGAELKQGYIPLSTRRIVWNRDGASCDFVGADGKRWDPLESTCRHASLSIL